MMEYEMYCGRQRAKFGKRFEETGLAKKFVRYFNSRERIKVDYYGEVMTGTVAATTGWIPCFLLMRTSRAIGSGVTLNAETKILAVKRGRAYVPVSQ
jgi:hypothetical protein